MRLPAMNVFRCSVLFAGAVFASVCPAADEKKVELPPFSHRYQWQEFTMTKEAPYSDDRHYRLKAVRKNGDVDLIDCAVGEIATKVVIVKPAPKRLKDGDRPQTMVVVAADYTKQSATIRELRMK